MNLGMNPYFLASIFIMRKSLPPRGGCVKKGGDKRNEMLISFPKGLCKFHGHISLSNCACLWPNEGHSECTALPSVIKHECNGTIDQRQQGR